LHPVTSLIACVEEINLAAAVFVFIGCEIDWILDKMQLQV